MADPMLGETQPEMAAQAQKNGPFARKAPSSEKKAAKKKLTRRALFIRIGILCALLLLAGGGAILGVMQYQQYHKDLTEAQAGVQHLRKAETFLSKLSKNPFDSRSTAQAQQEFSSALTLFQQIGGDLNALPGMSTSLPLVGSKVAAAQHLLPLAIEVSQMGITACKTVNLLAPELRNPMGTTGPKLTQADLTTAGQNLQQIQTTLNLLIAQVDHLQPSDLALEPSLGKYIGILRKDGPKLQDAVTQAQSFLSVAPLVLGVNSPANYLIEILDSTELRPGGGFIGNYGLVTLTNGHISAIHMTDVDLIDKPFEMAGHTIPYPPAYHWFDLAPESWSFRDSNLDADFPTNARNGEQTYAPEENYAVKAGVEPIPGGDKPLQGVIAITPWFIQGLLNITGPINMQPQYDETVTAQNFIDRIHLHQLGNHHGSELIPSPDGHSSQRKRFTSYLADHLIARIRQMMNSSTSYSALFKLFTRSLSAKDIQVYFNAGAAENVLQHYHLAASVQAPSGDGLFVVDANFSPNKANDFIQYTMHDQVTIDTFGNAVHHTTLSYAWILQGQRPDYGLPLYRDYAHVYVPSGSTLQSQTGWQPQGTDHALGRTIWMGYFTLEEGQTRTIMLTWTTPKAAQLDSQGWHYRYLVQKQAGDTWTLNLQVTIPACAAKIQTSGGLVARSGQPVEFAGPLNEDKNFEIDYTCS